VRVIAGGSSGLIGQPGTAPLRLGAFVSRAGLERTARVQAAKRPQSMPGGREGNVALLGVEILVAVPLLLRVVNRRRILGLIREMRTAPDGTKGRKRRS
jgi:hypothetical protein